MEKKSGQHVLSVDFFAIFVHGKSSFLFLIAMQK